MRLIVAPPRIPAAEYVVIVASKASVVPAAFPVCLIYACDGVVAAAIPTGGLLFAPSHILVCVPSLSSHFAAAALVAVGTSKTTPSAPAHEF